MLCLTFEQIARMEGQISSSLKFDKRACRKSSLAFHWNREWKKFASDEAAHFCPMSNLIQKHPQAQLIASFSTFSCSCFCCRTLPLSHCKEAFCAFLPKRLERRGPTMVLTGQFLFWIWSALLTMTSQIDWIQRQFQQIQIRATWQLMSSVVVMLCCAQCKWQYFCNVDMQVHVEKQLLDCKRVQDVSGICRCFLCLPFPTLLSYILYIFFYKFTYVK